jgi:hypothetical protein
MRKRIRGWLERGRAKGKSLWRRKFSNGDWDRLRLCDLVFEIEGSEARGSLATKTPMVEGVALPPPLYLRLAGCFTSWDPVIATGTASFATPFLGSHPDRVRIVGPDRRVGEAAWMDGRARLRVLTDR